MKKIFIFLLSVFSIVSLTGCSTNDFEDIVMDLINNDIHLYTLSSYIDEETNEVSYDYYLNNDIAVAILMLNSYIQIDLETIINKVDKDINELKDAYEAMEISVDTGYNMILAYKVLDLDLEKLTNYYTNLTKDDLSSWNYITTINCLNMLGVNDVLKDELITIVSDYETMSSDEYFDADTASMIIVALQGSAPTGFKNYLLEQIDSNSYISTWGAANAASTAQGVIALMTEGLKYNNNSVSKALLDFKFSDGGFKWLLEDDCADFDYSSPQVFLALSVTYLFEETGNKILLY